MLRTCTLASGGVFRDARACLAVSGAECVSEVKTSASCAMVAADDPRLAKVGFAKLVGSGIELYAKKHEITLGRLSKSGHVDIVLGGWDSN